MTLQFALSTRWNAFRHHDGAALVAEIASLGFTAVELGYDLRMELVPGILDAVRAGHINVGSVHNYCPVPVGIPNGHPELFSLASRSSRERRSAVTYTIRTVEFAHSVKACVMVVHAGRVDMPNLTADLVDLYARGMRNHPRYEKTRMKLLLQREKRVGPHLDALSRSIEEMLPSFESAQVRLAFENLPSWEAIPTETEMEILCERFGRQQLGYWHDTGHGQVRENLGLIGHQHWFRKLNPLLAGMHLHDVMPPADDHLMPPYGTMDFTWFRDYIPPAIPLVFEPIPDTPAERVRNALHFISKLWQTNPTIQGDTP